MQKHDPASPASYRAVVITPNSPMAAQLDALFATHLAGAAVTHLNRYPSAGNAGEAVGSAPSQLVFLDVSSSPEQALQLLTELGNLGPSTQVLALLTGDHPDLILRCLRAGAVDFLLQPFTGDQVEAVLAKVARLRPAATTPTGNCKIVAVMPAKGACGATTLASNLAFYWKRLGAKRVLLADMDALTGTLAFLLKVKATRSFLDVLQRASELDEDLWRASVNSVTGVDVLLAPDLITEGAGSLPDPAPILNYARTAYDVVILDTSGVYGAWNLSQARAASSILLVTTNELPALQATQRAFSYLDSNKVAGSKVHLVVNRYHKDVGLNRDMIGTALHAEVFDTLPSDYDAVQKALMDGKPVQSGTPLGKSLTALTNRLAGPSEKPSLEKKAGALTGLLSLFSKTTSSKPSR